MSYLRNYQAEFIFGSQRRKKERRNSRIAGALGGAALLGGGVAGGLALGRGMIKPPSFKGMGQKLRKSVPPQVLKTRPMSQGSAPGRSSIKPPGTPPPEWFKSKKPKALSAGKPLALPPGRIRALPPGR